MVSSASFTVTHNRLKAKLKVGESKKNNNKKARSDRETSQRPTVFDAVSTLQEQASAVSSKERKETLGFTNKDPMLEKYRSGSKGGRTYENGHTCCVLCVPQGCPLRPCAFVFLIYMRGNLEDIGAFCSRV